LPKSKITLERATGVVALSYLVLIPVCGVLVWQKINTMDKDLNAIWEQMGMDTKPATTTIKIPRLRIKMPTFEGLKRH
jgi:ABC-type Fe3+ transport system permease subunit